MFDAGWPRAAQKARMRSRPGAQAEPVLEHEAVDAVVEVVAPPALVAVAERRLVGGAGQVRVEHERVGRG